MSEPPSSADDKPVRLTIRVGLPGGAVHTLELDEQAPLSAVVEQVLQVEQLDPTLFRVRLISAGRLYADHSRLVKDVVDDGGFLHCAISDAPPPPQPPLPQPAIPHTLTDANSDPTGVTIAVGPYPASADGTDNDGIREREAVPLVLEAFNVDGEVRIIIPEQPSRAAYDRLADAGLTHEEIRMIRRHVRMLRREALIRQQLANETEIESGGGGGSADGGENQNQGDAGGPARTRSTDEEIGADTTSVTSTADLRDDASSLGGFRTGRREQTRGFVFASGGEGTNGDFLMGCIFGYLLGIIVLVLLLDTNATRRWRVGIIAGVATNCAFGILRTSLYLQNSFHT